jgi:hypothetical protein
MRSLKADFFVTAYKVLHGLVLALEQHVNINQEFKTYASGGEEVTTDFFYHDSARRAWH